MSYDYHRPSTVDEALGIAAGIPEAEFVAGATDLLVQLRNGRPSPPALISLRGLVELGGIESSDRVRIGAAVPLSDVLADPAMNRLFPALVDSIASLGSPQIRNVATIGGNGFMFEPAQRGIELHGIIRQYNSYVIGFVNGNGAEAAWDNNSQKDVYFQIGRAHV